VTVPGLGSASESDSNTDLTLGVVPVTTLRAILV
jgi:hypothetical protein